jgi:hypothetical protein
LTDRLEMDNNNEYFKVIVKFLNIVDIIPLEEDF